MSLPNGQQCHFLRGIASAFKEDFYFMSSHMICLLYMSSLDFFTSCAKWVINFLWLVGSSFRLARGEHKCILKEYSNQPFFHSCCTKNYFVIKAKLPSLWFLLLSLLCEVFLVAALISHLMMLLGGTARFLQLKSPAPALLVCYWHNLCFWRKKNGQLRDFSSRMLPKLCL